jgi:hypothetical protein
MSIGSRVDLTFAAVTPGSLEGEINSKTIGIMNLPTYLRFLTTSEPNGLHDPMRMSNWHCAGARVPAKSEPPSEARWCSGSRWSGHALELTVPHKTVAEPR